MSKNLPLSDSYKTPRLLAVSLLLTTSLLSPIVKAEETPTQLPTVTVQDTKAGGGYNVTDPAAGLYKMTGPLVDTPQSVVAIPKELLQDEGVTTMRDALRNVPGLSLAAGEGGSQGDNLTIRGFSARSDFFLDGMRDFGSYYRDPFNLESIQVLEGPASILFGRGSTGGVVEQDSKQAYLGTLNRGTLAFGTDMTKRATVDINTPINGLQGAAFRVNVMANENNFAGRDKAENQRFGLAPTLSFGLGTDTRLVLSYFHQSEDDTPDYGIPWYLGHAAPVNRSNYYGFKDGNYLKTDADIGTIKLEHDLDDTTMLRDQFRYANYQRDALITEPQVPLTVTAATPLSSIQVTRNEIGVKSTETYLGNQSDVTKKFETFGLKHDLVAGIELERETSDPTRPTYTGVPTTSLLNPNEDQSFSGASTITSASKAAADTAATYVVDTFHVHKMLDLIGGWRFDHINSYSNQTIPTAASFSREDNLPSWRGAVVFKPQENGSIYFDYGTSFDPSIEQLSLGVSRAGSPNSATVAPEKNKTYEVGTKWDLLGKKLSTTFALFHEEKTNARETDPINPLLYDLSGDQVAQGFQAGLTGHLTERWQIISGYALIDTKIKSSVIPGETGNQLANAPKNTFNLFTTYKLPTAGNLLPQDLEIGGGMNYVSSRYGNMSTSSKQPYLEQVPGYVTFNAMAKYPITKAVDVQLNVYNITNKYYIDEIHPAHIVPGEGRTALLSTSFSF